MTFISLPDLISSIGIVTLGAVLQGTVGFGSALIAAPFLVLIEPRLIPGPLILAGFFLSSLMSYRDWRSIDFQNLKWALFGRIPSTALTAILLVFLPKTATESIIGLVVLLAVALSFSGLKIRLRPITLFSAGVASGFMGTMASIGGPPIAILMQYVQPTRFRGTLGAYFGMGSLMSIIALTLVGRFRLFELFAGLSLFPGILLGFFISNRLTHLLHREQLRPIVLTVSALAALAVILRALLFH